MHLSVRQNFIEKASYVARTLPGMSVVEQDSFVAVDSGLPSDTFNVIVVKDLSQPAPILKSVDSFFAKHFPLAVWYWENDEDRSGIPALSGHGLHHAETHAAMYADLTRIQLRDVESAGLEIKQTETADDLLSFASVMSALFGERNEARQILAYFQRVSAYPLATFPAMHYYLGILNGVVVACGTLFVGSETTGIYDIVTSTDYRRRGIGSTMFQHILQEATRHNRRFCVLQASPDGSGIYLRAGFQVTGEVFTFEKGG